MTDQPEQPESTENADQAQNAQETAFRPLTRSERRNLWLKEAGEQDVALQSWARLIEQQGMEIEVMFQMRGLLVFGTWVSTEAYARFYINLHEEMYRQSEPETADFLLEYYSSLLPAPDQPEIGLEGLPILYRYAHLRDATLISGGHKVKLPYWRGKIS